MVTRTIVRPGGTEVRELTAEEKAEREQSTIDSIALKQAQNDAAAQKVTDQASGNQKFLDLGLTQAEATALTGYTPPAV